MLSEKVQAKVQMQFLIKENPPFLFSVTLSYILVLFLLLLLFNFFFKNKMKAACKANVEN